MAGKITTNSVVLGDSITDTQNFVLKTNADGTATLARGALGGLGTVFGVNGSGALTGATLVSPTITGATITVAATAAPAFSAYLSPQAQAVTASTWTKVTLNVEEFDTASAFDSTTNYRFTPQVAGYYQISACLWADATNYANTVRIGIYKNGAIYKQSGMDFTGGAGGSFVINVGNPSVSACIYLNGTSDYIELYGFAGFSTGPKFEPGVSVTYMSGAMIRSA